MGSWTLESSTALPGKLGRAGSIIVGNKWYLMGGYTASAGSANKTGVVYSCDISDPVNTWTTEATTITPSTNRFFYKSGDKVVGLSGEYDNNNLIFDVDTSNLSYPTTQAYYIMTNSTSQIDTSTWFQIDGVTINQTTPTNTDIKYLVSFDGRSTWKYWNGSSWISSNLNDFQTNGMVNTLLESLSSTDWSASGGFDSGITTTLDFAIDFSTSDTVVTPELSGIEVQYSE